MSTRFPALFVAVALFAGTTVSTLGAEKLYSGRPIRALLITGGCYHNYAFQSDAITNAIGKVADVQWTILSEECTGSTRKEISLYDDPNWAKPYDIVVHNECFADTTNLTYIRKITAAHQAGVPAIVMHCAMHTYRETHDDDWREFLGVTSRRHEEKQGKFTVKPVAKDHPIMQGFPESWTTPMDELYVIEKLWPGAQALAVTYNENVKREDPVAWINNYRGTRVFGTTYGHSDDTFRDPVYLNYLTRGFLWAAGKLK